VPSKIQLKCPALWFDFRVKRSAWSDHSQIEAHEVFGIPVVRDLAALVAGVIWLCGELSGDLRRGQ
jgi:hypothetical protein